MKRVALSTSCIIFALFAGMSYGSEANAPSSQAVINELQHQIQQVQATIPKQVSAQAQVTNKAITQLQANMQREITLLQKQIQQLQTSLNQKIEHLQKNMVSLAKIR